MTKDLQAIARANEEKAEKRRKDYEKRIRTKEKIKVIYITSKWFDFVDS